MTHSSALTPLRCTVRGCARPLRADGTRLVCDAQHSFDRARGGWYHLAQPQDARSRTPGDAEESIAAREELLQRGLGAGVLEAVARHAVAGRTVDVGCGGGALLARLAQSPLAHELYGVDLSGAAVQRAARRRCATIVVANADRGLPFQDRSMDLVTSIDARRPVAEMARIVKPTGRVIVVVPAADDMAELRAQVLGRAEDLPGGAALEAEFATAFDCCARERVEERVRLDHEGLRALAAATYRLARRKERDLLDALATQEVVARHDLRVFELRS